MFLCYSKNLSPFILDFARKLLVGAKRSKLHSKVPAMKHTNSTNDVIYIKYEILLHLWCCCLWTKSIWINKLVIKLKETIGNLTISINCVGYILLFVFLSRVTIGLRALYFTLSDIRMLMLRIFPFVIFFVCLIIWHNLQKKMNHRSILNSFIIQQQQFFLLSFTWRALNVRYSLRLMLDMMFKSVVYFFVNNNIQCIVRP